MPLLGPLMESRPDHEPENAMRGALVRQSKYRPHQGHRECARRRRQIARGILKVSA